MSPQQIELVQSTWQQVLPIREQAAALFYGRLFEADPALRALFRRDLATQGRMLMQALHAAVTGLHRLEALRPTLEALARRHVGYGVQPAHYDTVGSALTWTLQQGLGEAFTPPVREAWAAAYAQIATTMRTAAAAQCAAAPAT